jgi:5S rRNA maturation endonuclease (ribonuclease M5)
LYSGSAYLRLIEALNGHGGTVNDTGHRAAAQCPAHPDNSPSLSVTPIDGQVLIYCHAGCDTADVLAAVGLTLRDLYDDRAGATYDYADGRKVHRNYNKQFRQSGNTKGSALFHADRIGDARKVYVVEGEKDVLAVESAGAVAVCSAMGAGKARRADWTPLTGRHVIIVADKDEPGAKHAADIAAILTGKATSVNIVTAAVGKDVADHLAAGKTLDELVPADTEGTPRIWRARDLKPSAPPRWLAKRRLPMAGVSLLVGDEGIGKSLFWVLIVAAVTTGKPLPELGIPARDPRRVLLVCTEDDWTTTVRSRLEVAGADLDSVDLICVEADGSGAPVFPRDIHLIADATPAPLLVVVDAWLDTVPSNLNVKDPQSARIALHPWKDVATATDAAVLLLTHTNRVASANARDRYGITGELRKKARMTLYAQTNEDGQLIVGPEKMNTAAPIRASVFTIKAVQHFPPTEDHDGTVPILVYVGESDLTAREHLAAMVEVGGDEPGGNPAKSFIYDYVLSQGGEANAADVIKAGRAAGFSEQELKDARRRQRDPRIESRKASFGGGWSWAMVAPGPVPPPSPPSPPSPPWVPPSDPIPTAQGGRNAQGGQGGTVRDTPPSSPPSSVCRYCSADLPLNMPSQLARGFCHRAACVVANRDGGR